MSKNDRVVIEEGGEVEKANSSNLFSKSDIHRLQAEGHEAMSKLIDLSIGLKRGDDMKDQVVIEEGGMRFVMENTDRPECGDCCAKDYCTPSLAYMCGAPDKGCSLRCTSATKITPEPKMYFAWNREEAMGLIGTKVEFNSGMVGSEWFSRELESVDGSGAPFYGGGNCSVMIREIPKTRMTMDEFIEKYKPEDVEIVE